MTKYLETKKNSIEEAIKSVVEKKLDPVNPQAVKKKFDDRKDKDIDNDGDVDSTDKYLHKRRKAISKAVKNEGKKMQLKPQTKFDFRLFDPEDSPGSDKANDDMNKEIVKAAKMKDKNTAYQHMMKVQKKHSKHGATDTEPREMISAILDKVFESVYNESLDEGYEANVMKILKRKGLEGAAYFKNNNLMVSKRDFDAVKKALRFDKIPMTPPKIVVEDERMKRLTPRQRQALARVQAKPKSQVSLPKMPDFMKTKKEAYDIGNDYAKHTLRVTPGQMEDDVDELLGVIEKKKTSMREALAKMWGVNEGKNPFQKEEEKPLSKTMTGQKPTTVKVNPKIEDK